MTMVAAAGAPFFVIPQVGAPHPVDAIVVLGGPGSDRYRIGLDLAEQGYAPELVLSNPGGSENEWLTAICHAPHHRFAVSCFEPEPPTTRGEAGEIRDLADAGDWRSIIVVTFTPHVSRARYIVQRCFDGEITMVAAPTDVSSFRWAWAYIYQTAGYVKAGMESGC